MRGNGNINSDGMYEMDAPEHPQEEVYDWRKGWVENSPIIQVPSQEIEFKKIPMSPDTRAALTFAMAVVLCVTGLIAYLIYSVT